MIMGKLIMCADDAIYWFFKAQVLLRFFIVPLYYLMGDSILPALITLGIDALCFVVILIAAAILWFTGIAPYDDAARDAKVYEIVIAIQLMLKLIGLALYHFMGHNDNLLLFPLVVDFLFVFINSVIASCG